MFCHDQSSVLNFSQTIAFSVAVPSSGKCRHITTISITNVKVVEVRMDAVKRHEEQIADLGSTTFVKRVQALDAQ